LAKSERYQNRIELLQGTLDMLILQTLRWGSQHGYGISQAIRSGTSDVLQVETGSLYPALHRLEKQGWVKSEWGQSEHNQRAKFYRLTPAGKKHLASEHDRWEQLTRAIAGLMRPAEGEGQA
jgi:transcriptional regulator